MARSERGLSAALVRVNRNRGRDGSATRLLLVAHQADGVRRFGRVEEAPLRRDDDEVGAADRVADHERPGPFQVDDDEGGLGCGQVDLIENRVLADIVDNGEGRRLAGALGPAGHRLVGVGVDDRDAGALPRELGRQDDGGGGLSSAALGAGEDDGRHADRLPTTC